MKTATMMTLLATAGLAFIEAVTAQTPKSSPQPIPEEYVWTIVTIQPDETVVRETLDRDTGALICRVKSEAHWFAITDHRRNTLNEMRTEKWNQDFTVNALRYWGAGVPCRGYNTGFYYAAVEDWFDGSNKRLVSLDRRFAIDDETPQRLFDALKHTPSDDVPAPAWVTRRLEKEGFFEK